MGWWSEWRAWLREALFQRHRFEVWTAPTAGQPLFLEAYGLPRPAALELARGYLRHRPRAVVVVIDDLGTLVFPPPQTWDYRR